MPLRPRQLWNFGLRPTPTSFCATITLPPGVVNIDGRAVTVTSAATFDPDCTTSDIPFYASSLPLVYAIAAATVLAWVLVVMLVVSPRTFHHNSAAANAMSFASGRAFSGAGTIGVGSRPWLQKAAALGAAISLTIATVDTFKAVRMDHLNGVLDGEALRQYVEERLEIRIIRTFSNIFVWLAQVQTLIRLFPRHREKVLIKWIGFALIIADIVFSCLNSFLVRQHHRPRHFDNAIAALNYLFQLAVSLLYAAWVLYYSWGKRRYAYWHWKMKNVSLIALLSVVSILTPVVLFVTDITIPEVAGWGDYFRWVGAAAASVVVWEWVERIEALERDEKKDGILGQEVYDDDMLVNRDDMIYVRRRNDRYVPSDQSGGGGILSTVRRLKPPSRPPSPVNRGDTTSAASTVYVVRDDSNTPLAVRRLAGTTPEPQPPAPDDTPRPRDHWQLSNPFKRKRTAPPAQVRAVVKDRPRVYRRRAVSLDEREELPWIVIPAQPRGSAAWSPSRDLPDDKV